jgi:hypothetical protein
MIKMVSSEWVECMSVWLTGEPVEDQMVHMTHWLCHQSTNSKFYDQPTDWTPSQPDGQFCRRVVTYMLVSFLFIFLFRISHYKFMIFCIRCLIVLSMYSFLCLNVLFLLMKKTKNGKLALLHLGLYIKHLLLHHFSPTPNRRQKPNTESYIYIQNKTLDSENCNT